MLRERLPKVIMIRSATIAYILNKNQCFYRTNKAFEIWDEKPLLRRIKRIPRSRIFWVSEK